MTPLIAAIDQGTTSTRCLIFNRGDRATEIVGSAQVEHQQIYPRPGWVEHDPLEIWRNTETVIREAIAQTEGVGRISAVGITNQRETIVFWNRHTGQPYTNAIVWQDTRTHDLCEELEKEGGPDRFRASTGLPLATYFSGPKIKWALDQMDELREAVHQGEAICGTIDSWLIWNLTGKSRGGNHVTDVTNASRTQLMNLDSLDWDEEILEVMDIPAAMLPRIAPSSHPEAYGTTRPDGPFGAAIPICGVVGDQQAALLGQCCFNAGEAKCTYGTGCFLLLNTGEKPVHSKHGLLTTLGYQFAGEKPVYALEGSVAIAGALVQWLRDNLGLINTAADIETLAGSVDDSGGCYIVPAFSGLFTPHWRSDARGVIAGLTRFINKGHIARAALEATCFQTREVLEAMREDAGLNLPELKVDGGMVVNNLLMQFQSDLLDLPVVRPQMAETTALGAAFAAGLAAGEFSDLDELRAGWREGRRWNPQMDETNRKRLYAGWHKAVERTLNWVE